MLPLTSTVAPTTAEELGAHMREAFAERTPMYPLGGQTALDYGLLPKREGIGLDTALLNRVVDYPSRDMTITVEAGIAVAELRSKLAAEGQRLPVDAPRAAQATLGGLLATNHSGPRRFGYGTLRDYVIGISAIDGRGVPFKGGGRVVKNVAGYDFCKLLTGSLGTLAVISQVTLKVKPKPQAHAFLVCEVPDWDAAEKLLAAMINSQTAPVAVELLAGPAWESDAALGPSRAGNVARLLIGFEGTQPEVAWQVNRLQAEWREQGVRESRQVDAAQCDAMWQRLVEFPAEPAALTLKAAAVPSATVGLVRTFMAESPAPSIAAQAGNGVVIARFEEIASADATRLLIRKAQPAARAGHGCVSIYACRAPEEFTRQSVWGPVSDDMALMQRVKEQLDPGGLLNPGRFIYTS